MYNIPLTETEVNLIDNELDNILRANYPGAVQELEDPATMPAGNFELPVEKTQTIQGILRKCANRNLYFNNAKEMKA